MREDDHQLLAQDSQRDLGGWRRARRGKPLSEMTRPEIRRAMWVAPLAIWTTALSGFASIGRAAIQETVPLWLAGAIFIALVIAAAIATQSARCSFVARLAQLDRLNADLRLGGEPVPPLPMTTRAWLIAAPLAVVAVLVLAATSPGDGDTCASRDISTPTAREGSCVRGQNLFGGGTTYNVVDAGHVLHMPGIDARLLATRTQPVIITDPQRSPSFYPDGTGILVCFEIAITNRQAAPLSYDVDGADVDLLLQGTPPGDESFPLADQPGVGHEPIPALAALGPIQPGQTTIGWVAFDAPQWALQTLTSRASDLEFRLPTNSDTAEIQDSYVGQIRLWKTANTAGASALTSPQTT